MTKKVNIDNYIFYQITPVKLKKIFGRLNLTGVIFNDIMQLAIRENEY